MPIAVAVLITGIVAFEWMMFSPSPKEEQKGHESEEGEADNGDD